MSSRDVRVAFAILAVVILAALGLAILMPHFGFNTPGPHGYGQ